MTSVSVFLNSEGLTCSPKEEGIVRVFAYDPAADSWEATKEFEFSLLKSTSMFELRNSILGMVQRLGDCRIFAAREVAGQLYSVLEANRFSIYEVEGKPEQFLKSILVLEEEETKRQAEISAQPVMPYPRSAGPGKVYFIDLKAALNTNPGLTSKKILLPFFAEEDFKVLEVICEHMPKWFDDEFKKQGLTSAVTKLDENEYRVVISRK